MKYLVLALLVTAILPQCTKAHDIRSEHTRVYYEKTVIIQSVEFNRGLAVSGATSAANNFGMENYKVQFTGGWGWFDEQNGFALGVGKNISGTLIHGTIGATFDGEAKQATAGFRIDF